MPGAEELLLTVCIWALRTTHCDKDTACSLHWIFLVLVTKGSCLGKAGTFLEDRKIKVDEMKLTAWIWSSQRVTATWIECWRIQHRAVLILTCAGWTWCLGAHVNIEWEGKWWTSGTTGWGTNVVTEWPDSSALRVTRIRLTVRCTWCSKDTLAISWIFTLTNRRKCHWLQCLS